MEILVDSFNMKRIEAMLEDDKRQIDKLAIQSNSKGSFDYWHDKECINRLHIRFTDTGLNFFMRGVLMQGMKFKVKRIDRNAKIKAV